MKIALISDIHDNFHNLLLALEDAKCRNAEYIICLGDLMNSGVAKILAIQEVPVYLIWGNNDGEKSEVLHASYREGSNLTVGVNVYDFLDLGGRKIFVSHYNDLAIPMAQSKNYDAVFYGHDHLSHLSHIDDTLVLNPGEICALKTGTATYAMYNADDNSAEIITLEGAVTTKTDLVNNYFKENMNRLGFRSKDSFDY